MKRVRNSLIPEVHEDLFVANGSQRLAADAAFRCALTLEKRQFYAEAVRAYEHLVRVFKNDPDIFVQTQVAKALLNRAVIVGERVSPIAEKKVQDTLITHFVSKYGANIPVGVDLQVAGAYINRGMLLENTKPDSAKADYATAYGLLETYLKTNSLPQGKLDNLDEHLVRIQDLLAPPPTPEAEPTLPKSEPEASHTLSTTETEASQTLTDTSAAVEPATESNVTTEADAPIDAATSVPSEPATLSHMETVRNTEAAVEPSVNPEPPTLVTTPPESVEADMLTEINEQASVVNQLADFNAEQPVSQPELATDSQVTKTLPASAVGEDVVPTEPAQTNLEPAIHVESPSEPAIIDEIIHAKTAPEPVLVEEVVHIETAPAPTVVEEVVHVVPPPELTEQPESVSAEPPLEPMAESSNAEIVATVTEATETQVEPVVASMNETASAEPVNAIEAANESAEPTLQPNAHTADHVRAVLVEAETSIVLPSEEVTEAIAPADIAADAALAQPLPSIFTETTNLLPSDSATNTNIFTIKESQPLVSASEFIMKDNQPKDELTSRIFQALVHKRAILLTKAARPEVIEVDNALQANFADQLSPVQLADMWLFEASMYETQGDLDAALKVYDKIIGLQAA